MKKLKDEWQEVRLGDVVNFNPTEKLIKGNNYKKISMDCLIPKTRKIENYEVNTFNGGSKFRNGDTLMARITPCLENGKTAQVSILEENEIAFGSTEFIVLREKENISDNNFIYYLFNTDYIRSTAIKSMTGTSGRQRVQEDVLKNTIIKLPPLEEQKKIASILSSLDDKIELNNRTNKILEEMAQTIFKEWFINFNFPNAKGKPYKDSGGKMIESEIGEIPEGWEIDIFSNIASIQNGYAFKSSDYVENGINMIRTTDIHNNYINNENIIKVPIEFYQDIKYNNFKLENLDTLLVMVGASIGKVGLVTKKDLPALQNQNMWRFRIKSDYNISPVFIYFYVKRINSMVRNQSNGSAREFYRKNIFENAKIILPEKNVINIFNNIITNLFIKIGNNLYENQKLAAIRDTILPKLMNGEIRVK